MNGLDGGNIPQDVLLAIVASTLLILLLVTGITLAFYLNGRERIKQRIVLMETRLAFERELRQVETEVAESTLIHFGEELHDNVGQLLTALHIQIENQKLDRPELDPVLKPVQGYVTEISEQLRLLSRALNHDYIGHIGLAGALRMEVNRLNGLKRVMIHFSDDQHQSVLERNQELIVFRIFQEITQNCLRHSRAKEMVIDLRNSGGDFKLELRDNGVGFDRDAVLSSDKASGLRNIERRALLAGLELHIKSAPREGSLFIISKKNNLA